MMTQRIVAYRLQGKWYTPKRMSELKAKDDYARVYALPFTARSLMNRAERTNDLPAWYARVVEWYLGS